MDPEDDPMGRLVAAAFGGWFIEVCTLPMDVAKTRLQVQNTKPSVVPGRDIQYNSVFDCIRKTAASEGPGALWKGLAPAAIRQVCYGALALVIYEPIRDKIAPEEANVFHRMAAGGLAGALSIAVFNPTEVLKAQMMTSSSERTMRSVIRSVYSEGGITAFWAGLPPNLLRTFLSNAMELGCYDEAKCRLVPHVGDNIVAHLGAATCAGIIASIVSTPADVIKTQLADAAGGNHSAELCVSGSGDHLRLTDAIRSTYQQDGAMGFYRGFNAIVVRKVIGCSLFFVAYEKVRKLCLEWGIG